MDYIFPERELGVGNWPFLASEFQWFWHCVGGTINK